MELTLFQLINPLVFTVFAGGFVSLYLYDRRRLAAGVWAMSYLLGALAFLLDIFHDHIPVLLTSWASNAAYVSTALTFSIAVHLHCRRTIPRRILTAIVAIVSVAFLWYRFGDPDIHMRSMVLSLGAAALFGTCLVPLMSVRGRLSVERFLGFLLAVFCIQLLARPLLSMTILDPELTVATYAGSTTRLLFQVTTGITAVIVAMAIFLMLGIRIARDLRQEADSDPLTGLLNRRGFDMEVERAFSHLSRTPLPYSVVVADIDHFKRVNDTWGHAAGDHVIQTLAAVLCAKGRAGDHVARMGGEEFAVGLWGTDRHGAAHFADMRRAAFQAMPLASLPPGETCTVSFGVAERRPQEPISDLLARADRALYEAKRTGRNRVVVAAAPSDRATMQASDVAGRTDDEASAADRPGTEGPADSSAADETFALAWMGPRTP